MMALMERTAPNLVHVEHPRCPYCHADVLADDRKQPCLSCMAWHHDECFTQNGSKCATCGSLRNAAATAPVKTAPLATTAPTSVSAYFASLNPRAARVWVLSNAAVLFGGAIEMRLISLPLWIGIVLTLVAAPFGSAHSSFFTLQSNAPGV
jgi:hypothetical protein